MPTVCYLLSSEPRLNANDYGTFPTLSLRVLLPFYVAASFLQLGDWFPPYFSPFTFCCAFFFLFNLPSWRLRIFASLMTTYSYPVCFLHPLHRAHLHTFVFRPKTPFSFKLLETSEFSSLFPKSVLLCGFPPLFMQLSNG